MLEFTEVENLPHIRAYKSCGLSQSTMNNSSSVSAFPPSNAAVRKSGTSAMAVLRIPL
jgi:hypothetical protein